MEANSGQKLDQIFERLNYQRAEGGVAHWINPRNLRLHDVKREIEYNKMSISYSKVMLIVPLLWSSLFLYGGLLAFKAANSIIVVRYNL